ncbi:hypothetical protein FACS189443_6150 [Planctomycetales bacterium]|nr:hypothetical protein FACS189443_6150 [Planctomycetales bacterium]
MQKNRVCFVSLIGGVVLFFLFLAVGVCWFGGFGQLSAYVNGKSVYISPQTVDLGSCEAGTKAVAVFRLTNLTSQEITVIGERSSCTCTVSEKIPITAQPHKTIDLKINARLPKYDSSFDQTVTFMVAESKHLALYPVRVTAAVSNPLPRPPAENPVSEEDAAK